MGVGSQGDLYTLLALCQAGLQSCHGSEDPMAPALPSSETEWAGILTCALRHGLLGPIYRIAAKSTCVSSVTLLPIRSAAHAQSARTCYLVNELLEILAAFREVNISALALKGPALAARAYEHISDREFRDLDILVHPDDLDRASLVLHRRGYRADPSECPAFSSEGQYHLICVRHGDGATVELHWALNSPWDRARIESTGVWSRVHPVIVSGQPVLTLGIEDTLLFLCVHAFKHRWSRLKWLNDIACVLRSGEQIDWDALVLRSRRTGCYRMLLVGVYLASSLLSGSVSPPGIVNAARADRAAMRLAERIRSAILRESRIDGVEEIIYELQARERLRDHCVLVWRLLPRICRLTPEDGLHANGGVWTRFVALFKRPLRLFRTFGLTWVTPVFRFR